MIFIWFLKYRLVNVNLRLQVRIVVYLCLKLRHSCLYEIIFRCLLLQQSSRVNNYRVRCLAFIVHDLCSFNWIKWILNELRLLSTLGQTLHKLIIEQWLFLYWILSFDLNLCPLFWSCVRSCFLCLDRNLVRFSFSKKVSGSYKLSSFGILFQVGNVVMNSICLPIDLWLVDNSLRRTTCEEEVFCRHFILINYHLFMPSMIALSSM